MQTTVSLTASHEARGRRRGREFNRDVNVCGNIGSDEAKIDGIEKEGIFGHVDRI